MARLILDTGVLIAAVRGRLQADELFDADDLAIPAVVVAEYLAGVELDGDPGRAAAQRAFLEEVLAVVPVHVYDQATATHHAELLAYVRRSGTKRGAHDLVVAACARAADRMVLSTDNSARFGDLPGVSVRLIPS